MTAGTGVLAIVAWTYLRDADHSSLHYPWAPISLIGLAVLSVAMPTRTNAPAVLKVATGATALIAAVVWATSA